MQAWNFDKQFFFELSRKYGVDIRLQGYEQGVQFGQDLAFENGECTIDECIEYDDWVWGCPFPYTG